MRFDCAGERSARRLAISSSPLFIGGTMRMLLAAALAALGVLSPAQAQDKTVSRKPLDPALAKMAEMIGGIWSNDNPKFRVEFHYDWAFNQTAVRGIGVIDKGGANETPVEAMFGWDADKKTVYYLDHHG